MKGLEGEKLPELLDQFPEPLVLLSSNGVVQSLNFAGLRLLEIGSAEAVQGQPLEAWVEVAHRPAFRAWQQKVLAGKPSTHEFAILGSKGTRRWLEIHGVPWQAAQGEVSVLLGVCRDVTQRKQTETALRLGEERFRTALRSIGDAVITTDRQGRVELLNPMAEVLTGWNSDEARGRMLEEVFRIVNEETRQPVENPLARVLREGVVVGLANHTVLLARDGREIPIADAAAPIRDDSGAVTGVVLVFRDQTRERRLAAVEGAELALLESLAHDTALRPWLAELCTAHETLHPGALCSVLLLENGRLCHGAAPNLPEAYCRAIEGIEPGPAAGSCGTAAYRRAPVVVSDIATDPLWADYRELAREHGLRACWSIPILGGESGRVLGTFAIYYREPRTPSEQELQQVARWTYLAALAIERANEQQALRESEARYRRLFENSPLGIYRTTPDGRILMANPALVAMLGFSDFESLARQNLEQQGFHPQFPRRAFKEAIERDGMVRGLESAWMRADGRVIFVRENAQAVRDQAGRIAFYDGVVEDITERKQAELEIRRLNRLLAVLSEINQLIVRERDPRALLTGACQIAIEKGQLPLAWVGLREAAAGPLKVVAHAGVDADTLAALRPILDDPLEGCPCTARVLSEGQRFVCNNLPGAGCAAPCRDLMPSLGFQAMVALPLWVSGRCLGVLNLYATTPGFFHTQELRLLDDLAQDLAFALESAEREQQRQAAEARARRAAVFAELNPNPVLEFAADGTITYHNPAALALAKEFDGCPLTELLPADFATLVRQCLATGQPLKRCETRHGPRTFSWSFFPIPELGVVHGYGGEVTERVQLEEHLRQSQKMEAVGRLAGGVAHDFNNLLAVFMLQSELLLQIPSLPERVRSGVERIRETAERAANLTRQLLLFSRRQALRTEVVDLNKLVTGLTKMLHRFLGEDIHCALRLPPRPLPLRADPGMLESLLLNLAVNARDAMPRGGLLAIETGDAHLTEGHPELRAGKTAGPYVWVRVSDTGCGIAPEHLPHIFEPFFTTKEPGKGTGLGLATVHGVAEQHGGWVTVQSAVGAGTTFQIYLPALSQPIAEELTAASPLWVGGQETLLLVEDNAELRGMMQEALSSQGYHVLVAEDGFQALRLWPEHAGAVKLLLTDLVMPGGMNGRELARRLRRERPDLKVVYLSGYSAEWHGQAIQPGPGEAFLAKPCTPSVLLSTVRRCLDS